MTDYIKPILQVCRITLTGEDDGLRFTLFPPFSAIGKKQRDYTRVPLEDIQGKTKELRKALEEYVEGDRHPDALKKLADLGWEAFCWFKTKIPSDAAIFQRFINDKDADGRIEFESDQHFFPVDLFYISPRKKDDAVDPNSFLGLRMQVHKRLTHTYTPEWQKTAAKSDYCLSSDITLGYAFPEDSQDLTGPLRERQFFRKMVAKGQVLVVHERGKEAVTADDVIELWDEDLGCTIIHVSAHMKRDADDPPVIELSNGLNLRTQDFDVAASERAVSKHVRLVFLNCCRVDISDPLAQGGFLLTMFPNFAWGFVATKANVGDKYAAEFTEIFYRFFLKGATRGRRNRGAMTIGAALLETQRLFAHRDENFSALAYSIFNICPETHILR